MINSDFHLSTLCDPSAGGCGAKPGENCRSGCVTYETDPDWNHPSYASDVDPDAAHDASVDRQLGVW